MGEGAAEGRYAGGSSKELAARRAQFALEKFDLASWLRVEAR